MIFKCSKCKNVGEDPCIFQCPDCDRYEETPTLCPWQDSTNMKVDKKSKVKAPWVDLSEY
jgi:hypothetical protein